MYGQLQPLFFSARRVSKVRLSWDRCHDAWGKAPASRDMQRTKRAKVGFRSFRLTEDHGGKERLLRRDNGHAPEFEICPMEDKRKSIERLDVPTFLDSGEVRGRQKLEVPRERDRPRGRMQPDDTLSVSFHTCRLPLKSAWGSYRSPDS